MDEILNSIVHGAVIFGAFLSTWVGMKKSGQPYDVNQFFSSLIISVLLAAGTVNIEILQNQLTNLGWVGVGIFYLIAGFLVDKGLSKLDSKWV